MQLHVNLTGPKDLSGEIYRQIRRAMTNGRLRPGDCLPASRELARSLRVSRTTVTVAYDRLAGEGFVVSRVGAGTYVSQQVTPAPSEAKRYRAKSALQPRPVWDSIPLSDAFVGPAEFDFRTGLSRRVAVSPRGLASVDGPRDAFRGCARWHVRPSRGSSRAARGNCPPHRNLARLGGFR